METVYFTGFEPFLTLNVNSTIKIAMIQMDVFEAGLGIEVCCTHDAS